MRFYEFDAQGVYTGENQEFEERDVVPRNWTHIAPPDGPGFHIFDGVKWFTRSEYPQRPVVAPPKTTRLTRLQFRNLFTTEEKVALETARESNVMVRVFFDDLAAAEFVELTDEYLIEGVEFLEAQGLIDEGRAAEILRR